MGQSSGGRASMELFKTSKKESFQMNLLSESPDEQIDHLLMKEVRSRYLIALKGIFW